MTEDVPHPHDPTPNRPEPGAEHLAAAARQAALEEPIERLRERLQAVLPEIELGACIGRGGMGAVFRARQRALDRSVAVKLLLPPPGDHQGWSERFRREAQALARLQHPGIVTIHDYGQSGDLAWLVMELVEGANLRALMEDEHLSPREALALVPPICEALQYAHDRGIVHRDIKPENVLLDTEGRVKLVDFGLAKLSRAGEGLHLTRSDQAMGTPRYMAPEQLERPLEVDHRADIFSLGVVLYELLTGQVPAGVVEPPSRKVAVDVRLDEVVLRALQREPGRRYQSASDLEAGVRSASAAPVEERRPATGASGPPRAGFTWTDLLALVTLPLSSSVFAFAQQPGFGEAVGASAPGPLWEFLLPWVLVCALWWGLPVLTLVHGILVRRRGRATAPAMPMARTLWSLAWTLAALAIVARSQNHPGFLEREQVVLEAARGLAVIVGLLAATLGAWSQRGTHRRLFGPTLERALVGLTAGFAAISALLGLTASLSRAIPMSAPAFLHDPSLPLTLQLPVLAASVVAVVLGRSGHLRPATLILTIGVSLTLAAHLLGDIRYGGSGAILACLCAAVVCGLVTVAGTAELQERANVPARD